MYRLTQLLTGIVQAEVRGAQPTRFLNACTDVGLQFKKAEPVDDFSIRLTLRRKDVQRAGDLAVRSQCSLAILQERGAPLLLHRVKKRYLLLAGMLLVCLSLFWSFLHVWELEVVGNTRASTAEIMTALEKAGVGIGSFWPSFSNEQIKTRVLQEVPELSWIAVNVSGSRAVASVRERVEAPELYDEKVKTEIIAEKAGIVTQVQALQGSATVKAGQTVLLGEVLVSGEMQSSFEKAPVRSVHAKAQVYARTWYTLTACAPLEYAVKEYTGREKTGIALEIGKQRINFLNVADNSGNPDIKYDKLSKDYKLAIEGVFATPLALTLEKRQAYTLRTVEADAAQLNAGLEAQLMQRLQRAIGEDGGIKSQDYSASRQDGMLYVTLRAECVEDIAAERRLTEADPAAH